MDFNDLPLVPLFDRRNSLFVSSNLFSTSLAQDWEKLTEGEKHFVKQLVWLGAVKNSRTF